MDLLGWTRRGGVVWGVCAGLAALADFFFYGHKAGWDVGLFSGIAVAAIALRSPGLWRSMAGRMALALAGLILLALVEEPSPLAILMAVFSVGMLALVAQGRWTTSLMEWMIRWMHMAAAAPVRWALDWGIVRRWAKGRPPGVRGSPRRVLRWLIPVAAGAGFLILFTVANPVLEQGFREAWTEAASGLEWLAENVGPERVGMWLVTGIAAYGLLRHRAKGSRVSRVETVRIPPVAPAAGSAHGGFIVRCLVVFNLVFGLQSLLDVAYLFGGAALPAGMTYAYYAHRGAYPLVATALLAGLFVLAAFRSGGAARRSGLARGLVYLWIGQNVFLLISTIWRLWLYVDAYSLTRMRLATVIWIGLVGIGFLLLVRKIVAGQTNVWLWRSNAGVLAGVLYLCAFVNFPGLIADFNVRHCREIDGKGAPLDVGYLRTLGPAALPAVAWVAPRLEGTKKVAAMRLEMRMRGDLAEELKDWRGWTLRRARARGAVGLPEKAG